MNATIDQSFPTPPSGGLLIWADTRQFYIALPMTAGGTYILGLPRTQAGLAKAFALIAPPQDTSGLPRMSLPPKVSKRPQAEAILQRMKLV